MEIHERFRIEELAADGEPLTPDHVNKKFTKQCGVIVRDYVPIVVHEWHKTNDPELRYVSDIAKDNLWIKLMANFILPAPEDPEQTAKVKEWALRKMGECFKNWKKRLNNLFILKDKTPDWDNDGYAKIRPHWDEFVAYKKSEKALERSAINKKNAAKKKYHHTMGQGGYRAGKPKWEKLEADMLAKGITPETFSWIERARLWFYGHAGTLDSEGKCIYTKAHADHPLPIEEIRKAHADVEEGRFIPDRDDDELARALGNKEHK